MSASRFLTGFSEGLAEARRGRASRGAVRHLAKEWWRHQDDHVIGARHAPCKAPAVPLRRGRVQDISAGVACRRHDSGGVVREPTNLLSEPEFPGALGGDASSPGQPRPGFSRGMLWVRRRRAGSAVLIRTTALSPARRSVIWFMRCAPGPAERGHSRQGAADGSAGCLACSSSLMVYACRWPWCASGSAQASSHCALRRLSSRARAAHQPPTTSTPVPAAAAAPNATPCELA